MGQTTNFADRLLDAVDQKSSSVVVGLDPDIRKLPEFVIEKSQKRHGRSLKSLALAVLDFNTEIIDAVHDIVVAIKPQVAFYEALGIPGLQTLQKTIRKAQSHGLIVIQDAKRGDIGSTAEAYAQAHIGINEPEAKSTFGADAITVNPFLGTDSLEPFLKRTEAQGKGVFVLVKTSNPSSSEIQNLEVIRDGERRRLYEVVASLVSEWGQRSIGVSGYSSVGAVVGATFPEEAKSIRNLLPHTIFLVPGYGAQGGTAKDIIHCFNRDGKGAIVNSSREIIYAFRKNAKTATQRQPDFALAARDAALRMRDDINRALTW
jgi:orotidine-5'-phosphate decarboxylase